MYRRDFLRTAAGSTLGIASMNAYAEEFQGKKYRVGLIGSGFAVRARAPAR